MMHWGLIAFMGTPSGGEVILVLLVLLLLFGAKNLPKMARTLGRTMEEFRRAAREVSDEIVRGDETPRSDKSPRPLPGAVPQSDDEESDESGDDVTPEDGTPPTQKQPEESSS